MQLCSSSSANDDHLTAMIVRQLSGRGVSQLVVVIRSLVDLFIWLHLISFCIFAPHQCHVRWPGGGGGGQAANESIAAQSPRKTLS